LCTSFNWRLCPKGLYLTAETLDTTSVPWVPSIIKSFHWNFKINSLKNFYWNVLHVCLTFCREWHFFILPICPSLLLLLKWEFLKTCACLFLTIYIFSYHYGSLIELFLKELLLYLNWNISIHWNLFMILTWRPAFTL
jgi:hypothetical protein